MADLTKLPLRFLKAISRLVRSIPLLAVRVVLAAIGGGLVVAGIALWSVPASLITAGLLVVGATTLWQAIEAKLALGETPFKGGRS